MDASEIIGIFGGIGGIVGGTTAWFVNFCSNRILQKEKAIQDKHGKLTEVSAFLRDLVKADWYHSGD